MNACVSILAGEVSAGLATGADFDEKVGLATAGPAVVPSSFEIESLLNGTGVVRSGRFS